MDNVFVCSVCLFICGWPGLGAAMIIAWPSWIMWLFVVWMVVNIVRTAIAIYVWASPKYPQVNIPSVWTVSSSRKSDA